MVPTLSTRRPRIAVVAGRLALPPSYFVVSAPQLLRGKFEFSFQALRLEARRSDFSGFNLQAESKLTVSQLYRRLLLAEPDIVHQHWATWSSAATRAVSRLGVPFVVSVHGYDAFLPPSAGRLRWAKDLVKRIERRRAFRVASVVVVNSLFMAHRVADLGVPSSRIELVRHGIDTDYFSPSDDDRTGILFVGRLSPEKGPTLLLEALSLLPRSVRVPVTVVGDGAQRETLEKLAADRGLNVNFVGSVPREEVRGYLRRARLVVVPSVPTKYQAEGSGIAPLEAMACGTPTIVTSTGGLAENVPSHLSQLVSVPEPGALAKTMEEVLASDWALLSREVRKHVEAFHSARVMASGYASLYERLLRKP